MGALPLQGYTVADFTQVWAGPIMAGILADMGANVIKIESQAGTDASRTPARVQAQSAKERRLESLYFNRNRHRYVTLNLTTPRGAEFAKEIVKRSDAVAENFAPRVMAKFGLNYEELRRVKPDVVMISMSAGGQTGPWNDLLGYGPSINSLAGTDSLIGYPGDDQLMANVWDADPTIGTVGAFALLTALHHKKRTGQGQYIDMSFLEALGSLLTEGAMEYQMTGRVAGPRGNFHPTMSPHGVFPCAGKDQWVSIAVKTEDEWRGLCRAMGSPPWTKEQRYRDHFSRLKNRETLEESVAEWTRSHAPYDATRILQEHGVAAAPPFSVPEFLHDPHVTHRRQLAKIEAEGVTKEELTYGVQWRLTGTPGSIRRPSPAMGADNERFFSETIGLAKDVVRRLIEEKIIY